MACCELFSTLSDFSKLAGLFIRPIGLLEINTTNDHFRSRCMRSPRLMSMAGGLNRLEWIASVSSFSLGEIVLAWEADHHQDCHPAKTTTIT